MGVGAETLQHTVVADGLLATFHHRHTLALLAVTTNGCVDFATGHNDADHNALIDAADAPALQLRNQLRLRLNGLGHHHKAGGVLVQAVHDAAARDIDDVRHVVQQGIEQGAISVPGGRVNHQACGFVDDQDVVVFIDDIQLDVLGNPFSLGFLLGSQLKNRTAMDYVSRADNRSIHSQAAVFDPGGKARARVLSE